MGRRYLQLSYRHCVTSRDPPPFAVVQCSGRSYVVLGGKVWKRWLLVSCWFSGAKAGPRVLPMAKRSVFSINAPRLYMSCGESEDD